MVKLQFDIEPVAKQRPRFWNGRAVTPPKTREFEKTIKTMAREQYKGEILTEPLSCRETFYLTRGKTVKRKYPSVGADLDNYLKSLLDALNGVVYEDDRQIIEIAAAKKYSNAGMITISIGYYDE